MDIVAQPPALSAIRVPPVCTQKQAQVEAKALLGLVAPLP